MEFGVFALHVLIVYHSFLIICRASSVSLFCNSASGTKCLSQYCPQDTPTFTCTTTSGSLRWTPDGTLPTTPFTMEHSNIGVFVWLVNKTNEPQLLFKAQLTNKTSPNNLTSVLTATSPNVMGSTVRCSDDNEMKSLHVQLYGAPSSPKNSSKPITYTNGVPQYVHWPPPDDDACGDPGLYYHVTDPQGIPVCSSVPRNTTSCDISGLGANVSYVDVVTENCVGRSLPLRIYIPSWPTTTSHTPPTTSTLQGGSQGHTASNFLVMSAIILIISFSYNSYVVCIASLVLLH